MNRRTFLRNGLWVVGAPSLLIPRKSVAQLNPLMMSRNNSTPVVASAGYNPATDGTVVESLRADDITSLVDGNSVTTWQHFVGFDATSTAGTRPIYHTNVKNGKPAVQFSSSGGQFMSCAMGTLAQPSTVWVVFKLTDNASTYFLTDSQNAGNRCATFLDQTNSKFAAFAGSTVDVVAQDTNWHILYVLFNGASSQWAIDGGAPQTISLGTQSLGTGLTIGNNQAQTLPLNGFIGEILVQNAAPANVASIFAYLDARWAVY